MRGTRRTMREKRADEKDALLVVGTFARVTTKRSRRPSARARDGVRADSRNAPVDSYVVKKRHDTV